MGNHSCPTKEILKKISDHMSKVPTFKKKTDTNPVYKTLTCEMMQHSVRENKDGAMFSPASFSGTRGNKAFRSASGICIDYDKGQPTPDAILASFPDTLAILYSTHSHTPELPRYRVLMPFSRPVNESEHANIVKAIRAGIPPELNACIDHSCYERSRSHYLPSCPPEQTNNAILRDQDGAALDVDILINIGRELPSDDEVKRGTSADKNGNRPGDDYVRRHTIEDELSRLGWQHVREDLWLRPDCDSGSKYSAKVWQDGVYVYSTSAPVPKGFHDVFSLLTYSEYGGDFKEAARNLAAQGYGEVRKVSEVSEEQEKKAASCFPAIPFPLDILPTYLLELVIKYSKALQCPLAFMAMTFLTIISGAVGNSVTLAIKRSWLTAPFLWFGIFDVSGSGKTHPIDTSMKQLQKLQALDAVRYEKELMEYKADKAAFDKNRKNGAPPIEPEPMRHYYSMNFTIEALIPMFKASSRGIVLHVDELAGLLKGLNQYKSGKGSDDEQFLSLFNCGPLKSDRKSGGGFCRESGAAVIGGIQPEILPLVFSDKEHANGMVYRFLPMLMNAPPPEFSEDDISEEIETEWRNVIDWMYSVPAPIDPLTGYITKNQIEVSAEGKAVWKEFHDGLSHIQPFMPKRFRGYLPKLKTYCLKFMVVLHLAECYPHDTLALIVQKSTVEGAVRLANYFAGQALALVKGATIEHNPYHAVIKKALVSLQHEMTAGRVLLSRVRERVNEFIPENMALSVDDHKKIAAWLREMGFTVEPGAGNKSVVICDWENFPPESP